MLQSSMLATMTWRLLIWKKKKKKKKNYRLKKTPHKKPLTKQNKFDIRNNDYRHIFLAQSAGAVEDTDCTSAEG